MGFSHRYLFRYFLPFYLTWRQINPSLSTGEFVRNLVTLASGGSGGVVWRIRASETKLVCAVGSRNGTEETKLLVLDFDVDSGKEDGKKDASTSTSPIKGQVG